MKKGTPNALEEIVKVTYMGKTEVMTREEAMDIHFDGMECSEGAEHERHETLFYQLLAGEMECSDLIDYRSI